MNKEANITICRLKKRKNEDYLFLSINNDNMYFNNQPLPSLPAPIIDGGGNALVYASGPNENSASTLATTTIDDISLEGSFSFFHLYK